MNANWKKKWVAALRSRKYPQTTDALRDGTGFCCLGVACDIAKRRLGLKWSRQNGMGGTRKYLPSAVRKLFGLKRRDPIVRTSRYGYEHNDYLSVLNDDGVSFKKIAALIEKQL